MLSDYAARDAIQKVHLRGGHAQLLTDIISTLTPKDDGTRDSGLESLVLECVGAPCGYVRRGKLKESCVDASDFFQHRFPKLRNLTLSERFRISSRPKSHAMAIVNLSLSLNIAPLSILTTSQILSLLASNPNIRGLELELPKTDHDSGDGSGSRVPLHHLENLSLRTRSRLPNSTPVGAP